MRGESNHRSKLKEQMVIYIRDLFEVTSYSLSYIKKCVEYRFGIKVCSQTIHKIIKKQRWKHLNE